MAEFLLEDAKCDVTAGGFACGPVPGHVVAEIKVKNEETGEEFFLSDVEVQGTINMFRTSESLFQFLMDEDYLDPDNEKEYDRFDELQEHSMAVTTPDYDEFLEEYPRKSTDENVPLYYYLLWLIRCPYEEIKPIISKNVGKRFSEIEVPELDFEEDAE